MRIVHTVRGVCSSPFLNISLSFLEKIEVTMRTMRTPAPPSVAFWGRRGPPRGSGLAETSFGQGGPAVSFRDRVRVFQKSR